MPNVDLPSQTTASRPDEAPGSPKADPVEEGPAFETLPALYAALEREEPDPPAGFSDRLVPGEGPLHARMMLVGEQPGNEEDRLGRPFVGPAGRLLDDCLAQAGIDRSRVFVTNAVKRFKYSLRGKRRLHQTPNAGDIAHYRWWLAQEIRLVDPPMLVTLGATAAHAMLRRRQTLSSIRGEVIPLEGRSLIATIHPSFLLRIRDEDDRRREKERFIADLKAADKHAGPPV